MEIRSLPTYITYKFFLNIFVYLFFSIHLINSPINKNNRNKETIINLEITSIQLCRKKYYVSSGVNMGLVRPDIDILETLHKHTSKV
jgi:hypothetical protein